MKIKSGVVVEWFGSLRPVHFWIVSMAGAGLTHLALMALGGAPSGDLVVAGFGWLLVVLLFAADKHTLSMKSSRSAGLAGLFVLGFGMLQTCRMDGFDLWFLKILALLLFTGLLLAGEGWMSIRLQWRSIAVLLVVVAPEKFLEPLNHGGFLIKAHAWTAGFLLHCCGYDVSIHGNVLSQPSGIVEIQEACSGFLIMLLLLKIALMASFAFPLRSVTRLAMCAGALLVGLAVGVIRVAVLAAVVQRKELFNDLHGALGMNSFPLFGFLLFAPFLIPVEKPMANLLADALRNWKSAIPGTLKGFSILLAGAFGIGFGVCLLKDVWMPSSNAPWPPRSFSGLGLPYRLAKQVDIPVELQSARSNAVKEARRWPFGKAWENRMVLICSVTNAQVGPEELVRDPKLARFLDQQFELELQPSSSFETRKLLEKCAMDNGRGTMGVLEIPHGGLLGVVGIGGNDEAFFTTAEYNTLQRKTFASFQTWKDWLLVGQALKDTRYWLVVFVPGGAGRRGS